MSTVKNLSPTSALSAVTPGPALAPDGGCESGPTAPAGSARLPLGDLAQTVPRFAARPPRDSIGCVGGGVRARPVLTPKPSRICEGRGDPPWGSAEPGSSVLFDVARGGVRGGDGLGVLVGDVLEGDRWGVYGEVAAGRAVGEKSRPGEL
ncbi:hypothetical protein GCM10009678_68630 [Actinomadura kijaniata]